MLVEPSNRRWWRCHPSHPVGVDRPDRFTISRRLHSMDRSLSMHVSPIRLSWLRGRRPSRHGVSSTTASRPGAVRWLRTTIRRRLKVAHFRNVIAFHNTKSPRLMHQFKTCSRERQDSTTHRCFLSGYPNRVERCSKDGLSSFLAFPSYWNESVLKNRLDFGRTTL